MEIRGEWGEMGREEKVKATQIQCSCRTHPKKNKTY